MSKFLTYNSFLKHLCRKRRQLRDMCRLYADFEPELGAHEFIATKGASELNVSRPLDRLLITTSVQPDWSLIVPIMAPQSK